MAKKCISIAGIALLVWLLLNICASVYVLFGTNEMETSDISFYRAISGETDAPNSLAILGKQVDQPCPYDLLYINDLAPYVQYRFHYLAKRESVFQQHAYVLILEYDEKEYLHRKDRLEDEYTWKTELIRGENEGVYPECELDGFYFRAAEGGYYPKEMLFVGVSDDRDEIAYIYFYDQDLDYISPSVSGFLIEETGWRKVAH